MVRMHRTDNLRGVQCSMFREETVETGFRSKFDKISTPFFEKLDHELFMDVYYEFVL